MLQIHFKEDHVTIPDAVFTSVLSPVPGIYCECVSVFYS